MFVFTRIDPNIVRVHHEGPITRACSQQFRAFLKHYRGKLVIDMHDTPPGDMMRELLRVRPMLPQTACFGRELSRLVCEGLPGKDYYMHELRHFDTEAEALAWLGVAVPAVEDAAAA